MGGSKRDAGNLVHVTTLFELAVLVPLLLPDWLDPEYLITAMGNWALWGCALIIFAECGLFSLLPGDSLLFTIGMFVALGTVSLTDSKASTLVWACVVLTLAAVLGNLSGYFLGRWVGPPLFKPRDGFMGKVFNQKYVDQTHEFFDKYGSRALILARFVPMVRTFVTLVAGVAHMNLRRFMTYSAIGGVLWASGVTVLGFFLGQIPVVHNNIEVAFILIVFISILPMVAEVLLARRRRGGQVSPATIGD
ncbi:DedA family protein [Tessaracoccus antarcticus]|uniref:DedA family protein n=2 Tax=Tessaracoccus antarcticus TaxID=2479848 RepID=A0A3M0GLH5_9ACTN|nr:DedA family protein [Tessaracoccus antarcticus]